MIVSRERAGLSSPTFVGEHLRKILNKDDNLKGGEEDDCFKGESRTELLD
jgi:hypothetical protein